MHIAAPPARVGTLPALAPEMAVEGLCTAELLGLCTLRLWAAPHRQPGRAHPAWRDAFERARIDEAVADTFDAFMDLVLRHASRQLDVRCPHCPALGADEAAFLDMLRFDQAGDTWAAQGLLADWLPAAAARVGGGWLAEVAAALAAAGLHLPARDGAPLAASARPHGACLH